MTQPAGHPAAEYLEAIYEMAEERIPTVQARVAEWMGVSRASVSEAVKRMTRDGLVVANGRNLEFTTEGERVARVLVRRHRIVEHFLIRILGLPWYRAHEEAQGWEQVMSDEVEARIVELLDDPATCPHGNPIPGSRRSVDQSRLVALNAAAAGDVVVLRRLTEDLELELEVMRFFQDSGLMPGATIRVESIAPDGTMTLAIDRRSVALGSHLSDNLWVEPATTKKAARTRSFGTERP